MQIFPVTSARNEDVSLRPLLPNSDAMIAQISLGGMGNPDRCSAHIRGRPGLILSALARKGRGSMVGARPDDGAPIDFARERERDFAGIESGLDFIVRE